MKLGQRRLAPAEMYPAGEDGVSTRMLELGSGMRVRIVEAGEARSPAIVLVPGWGCSVWIFHANVRALARDGFRVIAIDPKGHGLSDKPREPSEYTSIAMRDHVLEIIEALGLERVALLGHSMGAAMVAEAAAAAPEKISKVILVAPVGFAGVPGMWFFRAITPSFAVPLLRLLAGRPLFRMILAMVYGSLRRVKERDVEEFYAPTQFPDFTRALRNLLHEFTWDAPFPRIPMPLLAIAGSKDILSRERDLGRHKSDRSETRTLIVQRAGHVILDEAPETVNTAIASFLRADGTSRVYLDSE